MSTRGNPRGRGGRGGSADAASTSSRGSSTVRGQGRGDGRGGPPRGGPPQGPGRGVSPPPAQSGFRGRGRGDRGRGDGVSSFRGSSRGGPRDSGPVIYREGTPARLLPPLEPKELQHLVDKFKGFGVTDPKRPLRPSYGTVGTEIKLRTNFFVVKLPKQPIYSYTVEISPKTEINRLKSRIFQLLEKKPSIAQHISYIAHDHSQRLVSAKKLPQPLTVTVPFYDDHQTEPEPGRERKVYTISIKFDREFSPDEITNYMEGQRNYRDYDPLPLISALNLVLQQHAYRAGVRSGKNRYFFPTSLTKQSLGLGLDAVQGFYSSVRPAFKQLLVNVNVCMTAFVKPGNLADKLFEFNQSSRAMPTLPKGMVKSIRVRAIHLKYKKKLFAIGHTTARNTYFECSKHGGKISVEQYFMKEYNRKLKYPTELPVVNVGSRDKPNWLPAELCEVEEGNVYQDKLNDKETANMIKYACNKPRVNADAIVGSGFQSMGLKPVQKPISGFGITIDDEMLVVPGRELNHPGLAYREGQARVQSGSWNILDVKFQRGAKVSSWWVLVVQDGLNMVKSPDDITGLVKGFQTKMGRSGMNVPTQIPFLLPPARLVPPSGDPDRKESLRIIKNLLTESLQKKEKPSFVLVLLERRDSYIYPGIKRIGDVEMGIHTVHMQLEKALNNPQKQDQYFSNVALKVNTKLGGINHLLAPQAMAWLQKKPTMMVGIDVTHPGPGSREGTPSIAAVVASVDSHFVQFPASLRIQKKTSAKEMLDELKEMMVERLQVYQSRNQGKLPERIFVYRDGVSEGQFNIVIDEEAPQILEAFQKFGGVQGRKEYRPTLSIIICGKRHHAKFWPESSQFADRNGNTRPGTVVDKGITGVFDFDFYLQAHAGIQGHVKATHYTVVYDENGLTANEVQQGTHDVSYLYARATKAVSLIPAAYYADLACERGRCYLNDFLVDDKSTVAGGKGKVDKDEEKRKVYEAAKAHWGQGLHQDIRGSMFYI